MKKLFLSRFIIGGVLILCLGLLAGCENSMYKEVDFGGTFSSPGINIEPLLIKEYDELVSLFNEYEIEWENGLAIWERYDKGYFKNKALIIYIFGVSGDVEPLITIDGVQVDDNIIKVLLVQHGTTTGLAYFQKNLVIEVTKSFIGKTTSVEVDIKVK